jgi:hypothetical protein
MTPKILIIYKADSLSAPGWKDRVLQPAGHLTDTLAESFDYSGQPPLVGDRVRDYLRDEATGHVTHARDGDWIVNRVECFSSFDTDIKIVLAYCSFQPVQTEWEPILRRQPLEELTASNAQGSP